MQYTRSLDMLNQDLGRHLITRRVVKRNEWACLQFPRSLKIKVSQLYVMYGSRG